MSNKIKNWGSRTIALLLCACTLASVFLIQTPVTLAATTPGTQNHVADGDTMDSYISLLNIAENSRYAGRVWADKSVFAAGDKKSSADFNGTTLTLNKDKDGYEGSVSINQSASENEDFLHVFSALGSSQIPSSLLNMPLDVVFIVDTSDSMASILETSGGKDKNKRLLYAGRALDSAMKLVMEGGEHNRVGLVEFNSLSNEVLKLGRYNATGTWDSTVTGALGISADKTGTKHYFVPSNQNDNRDQRNTKTNKVEHIQTQNWGTINITVSTEDRTKQPLKDKLEPHNPTEGLDVYSFSKDGSTDHQQGMTNTQAGIYTGMNMLANADDTKFWVDANGNRLNGVTDEEAQKLPGAHLLRRIPVVILLTDGQPTFSMADKTWWEPNTSYFGPYVTDAVANGAGVQGTYYDRSYYGNGMLPLVTATYMKREINQHYYGDENGKGFKDETINYLYAAQVYTFGLELPPNEVDDDGNDGHDASNHADNDLANVVLNPGVELGKTTNVMAEKIKAAWAEYIRENADTTKGTPKIQIRSDEGMGKIDWEREYNPVLRITGYVDTHDRGPHYPPYYTREDMHLNGFGEVYRDWAIGIANSQNGNLGVAGSDGDVYTLTHPNPEDDIIDTGDAATDLNYVNEYVPVNEAVNLPDKFEEIITKVLTDAPFVPVSGGNDLGEDSALTYMDPIGKYMEVKDVKNVLLFGEMYTVGKGKLKYYDDKNQEINSADNNVKRDENGNPVEYAYTEQYYNINGKVGANGDVEKWSDPDTLKAKLSELHTNPCYGYLDVDADEPIPVVSYKLSDITIYLKTTDDYQDPTLAGSEIQSDMGEDQSLYINIAVEALPLQLAIIETSRHNNVTKRTYSTNLEYKEQSTPLRVFYTVGMDTEYLINEGTDKNPNYTDVDLAKISSGYLTANRVGGTVYFYSNWYNKHSKYEDYVTGETAGNNQGYTYGDPVMTFSPSVFNRYYVFQKPLPLYSASDVTDGNALLSQGVVTDNGGSWVGTTQSDKNNSARPIELSDSNYVKSINFKTDKNSYFYIVADYYEHASDGSAEQVHYAVARRGSEFGSGLGGDSVAAGAYLCWYNIENGTYTVGEFDPNDENYVNQPNWVVAAKPSGLRVGDMAQSVHKKGEYENSNAEATSRESLRILDDAKKVVGNVTGTAGTFYLPSISTATETNNIVVDLYLGNNGRLEVSDSQLLVTKVMSELNPKNLKNLTADKIKELENEEFKFKVEFSNESSDNVKNGDYSAIMVKLDEWPDKWRAMIDKIELLTNNQGLLVGHDGKLAVYTEGEGESEKSYYIYIGSDDGSTNFAKTVFTADNEHTLTDTAVLYENVYLLPEDKYSTEWDFTKSTGDGRTSRENFPVVSVDITNPIGYEVDSDYEIRTTYKTKTIKFTDGVSEEFTLKHGEGLLFTGLDDGTEYKVTEQLTPKQLKEENIMLDKVTHEYWVWKDGNLEHANGEFEGKYLGDMEYDVDDKNTLPDSSDNGYSFNKDEGEFSYEGKTHTNRVDHVHYANKILRSNLGISKVIKDIVDPNAEFTFRVTLILPDSEMPLAAMKTEKDPQTGEIQETDDVDYYYFPYMGSIHRSYLLKDDEDDENGEGGEGGEILALGEIGEEGEDGNETGKKPEKSVDGIEALPSGELKVERAKNEDDTLQGNVWVGTVTLKHSQRIELSQLPVGTKYKIEEVDLSGYVEVTEYYSNFPQYYPGEGGVPDGYNAKEGETYKDKTAEAVAINSVLLDLPGDGGIGTRVYALIGGILVLLSLAMLAGHMYRSKREARQ